MLRILITLAAPPILLVVSDVNVLHRWPDVFMDLQLKGTPLHYASEQGHVPVVMALLDRGADVGARNKYVRLQRGYSIRTRCCVNLSR